MTIDSKIAESKIHLFEDFSTPTFQQWREVAEKSLKGAYFEENLVTDTYEGIRLQPLYRHEDIEKYPFLSTLPGDFPYLRGTNEIGNQHEPKSIKPCSLGFDAFLIFVIKSTYYNVSVYQIEQIHFLVARLVPLQILRSL